MTFPIKTIASWMPNIKLTAEDVSDHYDTDHEYMAFSDGTWNALELQVPNGLTPMASLKKDSRKGKTRLDIGNFFSERAKDEIERNAPGIAVRFIR